MYKTQQFKNKMDQMSEQQLTRFELIRNLTNNFKTRNQTAKEMDELLFRQLQAKFDKEKPTNSKAAKKSTMKKANPDPVSQNESTPVERLDDEIKFIRRYVSMNGKRIGIKQAFSFLSSLQRAILEKRIRKTSPYSEQIIYMQLKMIAKCNELNQGRKKDFLFKMDPEVYKEFKDIAASETVRPSTTLLKRYVGIQGKEIDKEKAERLVKALENAAKKKKILKTDPYAAKIQNIYASLKKFVQEAKRGEKLAIHTSALNGIESALSCVNDPDCGCDEDESLRGLETLPEQNEPQIINSMDFDKLTFETIGFSGKWLDFFGDPAKGFTVMVFGKPKMGKSYFSVEFAGYLARTFGKVLYVANEEKISATLKKKMEETKVRHHNLIFADGLPEDLSPYEFVFIDSVSHAEYTPEELRELENKNKGISFIYVFHTTKQGQFRGKNTYQHDVDMVVEVPEVGKAVQFGRFNQGGEMNFFSQRATQEVN